MITSVEVCLKVLVEGWAQRDRLAQQKADLLAMVIPLEVRQKMDDIEAEIAPQEKAISDEIAALENDIKQVVLEMGRSVTGEGASAIYTGGRVTWDTKGLDAAIEFIPALAKYRKVGDPFVTIRRSSGGKSTV